MNQLRDGKTSWDDIGDLAAAAHSDADSAELVEEGRNKSPPTSISEDSTEEESLSDDDDNEDGGGDSEGIGALPHIVMLFCVVYTLLGVTEVVYLAVSTVKNASTISTQASPHSTFLERLNAYHSSASDGPSSPQAKALHWLELDPRMQQYSLERMEQRYALATLYYATNGDAWSKQGKYLDYGLHECRWLAQEQSHFADEPVCNQGRVLVRLDLSSNNLIGTVPVELELLSSLQKLDLSGNPRLTGIIPGRLCLLEDEMQLEVSADCESSVRCC